MKCGSLSGDLAGLYPFCSGMARYYHESFVWVLLCLLEKLLYGFHSPLCLTIELGKV
jgi:hypothetical protein